MTEKTSLAAVLTTVRWVLACPTRTANAARLVRLVLVGAVGLAGLALAAAVVVVLVLPHTGPITGVGAGLAGLGAGTGVTSGIALIRQRRHRKAEKPPADEQTP